MTRSRRLLSDRQALLAFSLVLGCWLLFSGLASFDSSMPREDLWTADAPMQVIQIPSTQDNGTFEAGPDDGEWNGTGLVVGQQQWHEGPVWQPRESSGSALGAVLGLLQAAGGVTLGVYGVFRWSSAVAGDWLPPGRFADAPDEEE